MQGAQVEYLASSHSVIQVVMFPIAPTTAHVLLILKDKVSGIVSETSVLYQVVKVAQRGLGNWKVT